MVIGISFERYVRSIVEIYVYLKKRGVSIIVIIDNMLLFLILYLDIILIVISKGIFLIKLFVVLFSLINFLIMLFEEEKKDLFKNNV